MLRKVEGNSAGIKAIRRKRLLWKIDKHSNSDSFFKIYLTEASLCTCQLINQCVGGPTQKLLSKSRLFTSPDNHNTLMVAAGDESSSSVSHIDITQTSSLSICFLQYHWQFKTSISIEVSQKTVQGQSHKDKNTLCHNHVISIVCTLIKHSPWPIDLFTDTAAILN